MPSRREVYAELKEEYAIRELTIPIALRWPRGNAESYRAEINRIKELKNFIHEFSYSYVRRDEEFKGNLTYRSSSKDFDLKIAKQLISNSKDEGYIDDLFKELVIIQKPVYFVEKVDDIKHIKAFGTQMMYVNLNHKIDLESRDCVFRICERDIKVTYEKIMEDKIISFRKRNEGVSPSEMCQIYEHYRKQIIIVDADDDIIDSVKQSQIGNHRSETYVYRFLNQHMYTLNEVYAKRIARMRYTYLPLTCERENKKEQSTPDVTFAFVDCEKSAEIVANEYNDILNSSVTESKKQIEHLESRVEVMERCIVEKNNKRNTAILEHNRRVRDYIQNLNSKIETLKKTKRQDRVVKLIAKSDDLRSYWEELLSKRIATQPTFTKSRITQIERFKDIHIIANPNYIELENVCSKLGLTYTGAGITATSTKIMKTIGKLKKSIFNVGMRQLFDSELGKALPIIFSTGEKHSHGIDFYRCYASIAREGGFYVIDNMSEPERVSDDISPGVYYIETNNSFPFNGNGLYDYQLVQYGINNHLINKNNIKYMIRAELCNDNDRHMKKFVDKVYSLDTPLKKQLVNHFIGYLASTKVNRMTKSLLTSSKAEASYYFNKYNADLERYKELKYGDETVYFVKGTEQHLQLNGTNKLIQLAIVQRANMRIHQLSSSLGRKIVAVQTDAIYYTGKEVRADNNNRFNSTRTEKSDVERPRSDPICRTDIYVKKEWNIEEAPSDRYYDRANLDKYHRCFIDAPAGHGKTYLANMHMKHLGSKAVALSYTNNAANLIERGQTIHRFLGMDEDDKCAKKKLQSISKYTHIIIDEVSMIPRKLWEVLSQLPDSISIICIGDFRQLQPVEQDPGKYCDTEMFKSLCGYNKLVLRYDCRTQGSGYGKACIDFYENDVLPVKMSNSIQSNINIVASNRKRREINKMISRMHAGDKPHNIIDNDEYYCIFDGMFIVSNKNDKKLQIYNNERFVIESITNVVTLVNDNKKISITKQQLIDNCSPGYAVTAHKVQGTTISEPYNIYEWHLMKKEARYVCLTRTTNPEYVNIVRF